MTIAEWFNSEPVRNFRKGVLGNSKISLCSKCYHEEGSNGNSRRFKANQKSVIFKQAFSKSFEQSPGKRHFSETGFTTTDPIDLHIDLGNYCNLACKMCNPRASSKIAQQEVIWGNSDSKKYIGTDWTRNQAVWDNFKQQIASNQNLKNVHFMGGETLISDRFEDLVDTFIDNNRFDVCFSFVSNGTVIRPRLIDKLKKFSRVGIEISIETVDEHNGYQRQGTDTELVLKNIDWYKKQTNNSSITVTLRPAISLLTIGYYSKLLKYALDNQFMIKSLLVTNPTFLDVRILPDHVKKQYSKTFDSILEELNRIQVPTDYNASDVNNYLMNIKESANMCKQMLSSSMPDNSEILHAQLVDHCRKWDKIYGYDARKLYPELNEIWDRHGY